MVSNNPSVRQDAQAEVCKYAKGDIEMKKLQHYSLATIGFLFFGAVISLSFTQIGYGNNATRLLASDGIDLTMMEPFQKSVVVTLNPGQSGVNVSIDVPEGKLFVIEQVSATGSAPSDQKIDLSLMTHIAPDVTSRTHYLLADRQIISGTSHYKTSQMVKIYADTPYVYTRVTRSISPDTVTFRFTVSGYFVNK